MFLVVSRFVFCFANLVGWCRQIGWVLGDAT